MHLITHHPLLFFFHFKKLYVAVDGTTVTAVHRNSDIWPPDQFIAGCIFHLIWSLIYLSLCVQFVFFSCISCMNARGRLYYSVIDEFLILLQKIKKKAVDMWNLLDLSSTQFQYQLISWWSIQLRTCVLFSFSLFFPHLWKITIYFSSLAWFNFLMHPCLHVSCM